MQQWLIFINIENGQSLSIAQREMLALDFWMDGVAVSLLDVSVAQYVFARVLGI